ncbi:SAGA-associated factor 29 isoform 2-T3 [Hipposideros larvatus]
MALVSADSRIAELLTELHQLIKQTQEERSRSEHNLVNIQKTHERMQTENKISPYYRTKLRGLYTTAKADAEAECNILRKALDKIAEIKSLLEERRIAAKIAGLYNDSEPPRKTMRRGVLMTLLQQSAMTLPLWIGKPGDKPPPLCGAIPASGDYVAKPGDKVAARVKAVDGDEQWILAEVVSYSHATNKYEVDDIDEEGKERHTLSRRRIIPLPQWKANPETDPEALFQKEQLVLALYPQTTCFYRALIHTPPQRPQDDYSVLFEDTSYADGYSPPLNVAQSSPGDSRTHLGKLLQVPVFSLPAAARLLAMGPSQSSPPWAPRTLTFGNLHKPCDPTCPATLHPGSGINNQLSS